MQSAGTKRTGSEQEQSFNRQFIFDDDTALKFYRAFSPGSRNTLLQDFEPDGIASIISTTAENLHIAVAKFSRISEEQRRYSVIICRGAATCDAGTPSDGIVPPTNIPILHAPANWPDFIYSHWLKLLAGEENIRVFPQYFFSIPGDPELQRTLNCWTKAFAGLQAEMLRPRFPNLMWLERKCGLFNSSLSQSSKQLFGRPPGYVLQMCKTFLQTAECMRKEQKHLARTGTRKSFLQEVEWDYRKTLPKYFGIQYSALEQASRNRLWSVVFYEIGEMEKSRKR